MELTTPIKISSKDHDIDSLLKARKLRVKYKNKYVEVKNIRMHYKNYLVIILNNYDGTILPFDNWVNDLYMID
jgi:hypothetical protein